LRAELAEELEKMNKDIEEKGYASWGDFWQNGTNTCPAACRRCVLPILEI
jgi:hypothetical protein